MSSIKKYFLFWLLIIFCNCVYAQKKVNVLQVPGRNEFCKIDEKGKSILPSGRFVTPAGEVIRITHDPFGMAISPGWKKSSDTA